MTEEIPYEESELYRIRHSAAHVMAEAVLEHYPEAKLAIGPPIDDGFYYDFDLGIGENGKPQTFTPEVLDKIEATMKKLLKKNAPFQHSTMSVADAKGHFANDPYKLELIEDLAADKVDENGNVIQEAVDEVSIYQHRDFIDLCRGPHVAFTKKVKHNAVKLLRTGGAYWRGDENRPQLQRIYGTAWHNKDELAEYLQLLEEAQKRDHRRLGKDLDLFSVSSPEVGGGLVLWHPKGGLIRALIEEFARKKHIRGGYDIVYTPHIGRGTLWETSGHLDFYSEGMYSPLDIDGEAYYLKPMNCPFHIEIYKNRPRSYKELPIRMAEWGTVYRYERSGTLHGLARVRGFTQDDAHIFCTTEQVDDEISYALNFSLDLLGAFGFTDFAIHISTRPEKYVGDVERWDQATSALIKAVEKRGLDYKIKEGDGAFYGPKIDIDLQDAIGRSWQCSTIQVDFNLPDRFDMNYIGEDGKEHRPFMVHRALLGSMERFFSILIEHYGGAFPVWLAPVQAVIIPITDNQLDYARDVEKQLRELDIRATIDTSSKRMNAKIREAQLQKIPYMLVVGDREMESNTVAVRLRTEEDLGKMSIEEFGNKIKEVVDKRLLTLSA